MISEIINMIGILIKFLYIFSNLNIIFYEMINYFKNNE
jgi:hypothetical protein